LTADADAYTRTRATDFIFYAPGASKVSKGLWDRDPLTGLSKKRLKDRLDEQWLTADGNFNPQNPERPIFLGCNVFDPRTMSHLAGIGDTNMTRVAGRLEASPGFQTVVLKENGVRILGTHANSAIAGGPILEAEAREQKLANLPQFRVR
jgi:hypothetical protein